MHDDDIDKLPDPNSKSGLKREMIALQDVGERLIDCSPELLANCALPDTLLDALQEFKRLPNKHGARKRQLQYIGKLMRELDAETLARIDQQLNHHDDSDKLRFRQLEQWRDRLLADDREVLQEILVAHPDTDLQQLRQLVRQARKEQQEEQPPASSRKLFRLLRGLQPAEE